MYIKNSLFGMTLVIVVLSFHLVSMNVSMSDSLSSPEMDISLNEEDSFSVNKTPVKKADIFCKDGMTFMNEGLREEALEYFKIATDLYENALHNEYMQKEDLISIRENLKRMSKLLDGSPDGLIEESLETKDTIIISPINPTGFPSVVNSGTRTIEQVVDNHKEEPTSTPEIAPMPTPFVGKQDFGKAKKDEYWVIESTTMLLRNPELLENAANLLGNLIGGIRPETTFQILETKGATTGNIWKNVQVYNKKKEVYTKGWILSDTVGKARQVEKSN